MYRNSKYGIVTDPISGGVEKLASTPLVLNNESPTPLIRLVGVDADEETHTWPDRLHDSYWFVETGDGYSPSYGIVGPTGTGELGVRGSGTNRSMIANDITYGKFPAGDFAYEMVISRRDPSAWGIFFSDFNWPLAGMHCSCNNAANTIYLRLDDGSTFKVISSEANSSPDDAFHVLALVQYEDGYGKGRIYVNGISGPEGDLDGLGDFESVNKMRLFVRFSIGSYFDHSTHVIHLLQLWHFQDIGSHTADDIAKERAAIAMGLKTLHNHDDPVPLIMSTRASSATTQRVLLDTVNNSVRLFKTGHNWVRSETQEDTEAGLLLPGYRLEPTTSNVCLQSEDLTQTWTHLRADHVDTSTTILPDGEGSSFDCIHEDGTAAQNHYFTQAGLTTTADLWTYSAFAKMVNRRWIALRLVLTENQIVWYDLQDGVTGPNYVGTLARGMIPYGNGWWRCWFSFTGEAAAKPLFVYVADKAGDPGDNWPDSFDGADQDSFFFWGSQLNQGPLSSYIKTTTTSVQRVADGYLAWSTYVPDNFTAMITFSMPSHTPDSDVDMLYIDDGYSSDNRIVVTFEGNSGKLKAYTMVGGVTKAIVVPNKIVTSSKTHRAGLKYSKGKLGLIVDGIEAIDSDIHVPGMNRISIQPSGALVSLQWRNKWVTGQPRPIQPDVIKL